MALRNPQNYVMKPQREGGGKLTTKNMILLCPFKITNYAVSCNTVQNKYLNSRICVNYVVICRVKPKANVCMVANYRL